MGHSPWRHKGSDTTDWLSAQYLLEGDVACKGFPFSAALGLHCCAARSSRGAPAALVKLGLSGTRARWLSRMGLVAP